jgi:amidase
MMPSVASSLLAAVAATWGLVSLTSAFDSNNNTDTLVTQQIDNKPYPFDFPYLNTTGADLFPMRLCNGFKLEEASIDKIQAELESGKLTGVQLLECYSERIYQLQPYLK